MQKHMGRAREERANETADAPSTTAGETAKEMGRKLDALLDEIDDLLERNAKEFVAGYVQHGGE